MVNTPEFNLNTPFELIDVDENTEQTDEQAQEMLNQMWRNPCINDTYERDQRLKSLQHQHVLKKVLFLCRIHFPVRDTGL